MKDIQTIIKISIYMVLAASLSCYGITMRISPYEEGKNVIGITIFSSATHVALYGEQSVYIYSYQVRLNFDKKQIELEINKRPPVLEVNLADKEKDLNNIKQRITDVLTDLSQILYSEQSNTYTIFDIAENGFALLLYEDLIKLLEETIPTFEPVHIEAQIPLSGSKPIALSGYQHYTQLMKNYVQSWKNWFTRKRALGAAAAAIGTGLTLGGLYWYYSGKK